jgi:hypothetical protein
VADSEGCWAHKRSLWGMRVKWRNLTRELFLIVLIVT